MADERARIVIRPDARAAEAESASPRVSVQREPTPDRFELAALLTVGLGCLAVWTLIDSVQHPWLAGGAALLGGVSAVYLLLIRPLVLVARRLKREEGRLRSALTCPYCHDGFPEAEATVCDREGCGAFYHHECWAECSQVHGRCAVFACGSTRGHEVGPDALRRHVRRMLVAAALFPPRAVRRLRELETVGLKRVYDEAVFERDAIARSPRRSFRVGIFAMAASFAVAMGVIAGSDPRWLLSDDFKWAIPVFFFVPTPFFAVPFLAHLCWGLLKLLARAFRGELAALERADKGKADKGKPGKSASQSAEGRLP